MIVLRPALGPFVLPADENRQGAQRRIARRRIRIAHRTVVFTIGAVAPVVLPVLDRAPMLALRRKQSGRAGRGAAGQAEDHLDGRGGGGTFPDVAFDAQELRGAGKVGRKGGGGADPGPTPFAAAVRFVERLGIGVGRGVLVGLRRAERRGKSRQAVGWRRVLRGRAGCLWRQRDSRRPFRRRGSARARAGSVRRRR